MRKARIAFCLLLNYALLEAGGASVMQQAYMVKQAFPNIKNVGVLCHTEHAASVLKEMNIACAAYQMNLKVVHTTTLQDVREGFDRLIRSEKIDIFWIVPDSVTDQKFGRRFLSEKCLGLKIPLYVHSTNYVREGALLAVDTDESGDVKIYLNQKVGQMLSVSFPPEIQSKVIPVD